MPAFDRKRPAPEPTRLLTVKLTEAEHAALGALAAALGVSRSDTVRMALASLRRRHKPPGAAGDVEATG